MATKFLKIFSGLLFTCFTLGSCDQDNTSKPNFSCVSQQINTPFQARVGDQVCFENENIVLHFGKILEDSRCNIPHVDCFWEGRYVMILDVEENGAINPDTIQASYIGLDTLIYPDFRILISNVKPEIRTTYEVTDTSLYELEVMLVK